MLINVDAIIHCKIRYKNCYTNRFSSNVEAFYNPLTRVRQLWTDVSQKLTGKPDASKWIMFGSGLDKYSLDKKLFFTPPSPYTISCLYPGREGEKYKSQGTHGTNLLPMNDSISHSSGFGSGVGFTLNRDKINLITLYASTW